MYALDGEKSRPTLDINFLGLRLPNNPDHFRNIFMEICQIRYEPDGVIFLPEALSVTELGKDRRYSGIRIGFEGRLGNIRQKMQVDIGFGDVITPKPVQMDYPTLLSMDAPCITAYSVETIIAEKFEAMIDLADSNSRMKDFYDVHRLLLSQNFTPGILKKAVINTFRQRGTAYIENHPIFHSGFGTEAKRALQWRSFLKKTNLDQTVELADVLLQIEKHLRPVYESMRV